MSVTATKAVAFAANGMSGWVAEYFTGPPSALAVLAIGTFLIWLVPNTPLPPATNEPRHPVDNWGER